MNPANPERHYRLAVEASRTPVFLEPSLRPTTSTGSRSTFPRELLEWAQSVSASVGVERYLRTLALRLVDSASSEKEIFCRIVRFVQRALFRDPVAQPMEKSQRIPDAATILFCARGRCGHAAKVLAELLRLAGLNARITQLPKHIIAEAMINGRWVIADADAFKSGIVPVNRAGELLSREDLESDPYQLDRFPATGWFIRPRSRYTKGIRGLHVAGYVDALDPDERGFVSGYYVHRARGFPPSLPDGLALRVARDSFHLCWSPSTAKNDHLLGYRVAVGTRSRGWSYDDLPFDESLAQPLPDDVLAVFTTESHVAGTIPANAYHLCASVTAVTSRIDLEPETYFRPSEEVTYEL